MPEKKTLERARKDAREGKSPTTQAGEFVREEIHHIREGKHGARFTKQAIAIGLSKARRAGVNLPPPKKGTATESTRRSAKRALRKGRTAAGKKSSANQKSSAKRRRAVKGALKREGRAAASPRALARQARASARRRTAARRSAAARKAARTKGPASRSASARKAARTRARQRST